MASETKRTRRNTLERRCLGKAFKRLFVNAPKGVFKMLEKVKKAWVFGIQTTYLDRSMGLQTK